MSDELLKKLHGWLEAQGYPLEFATHDAFTRAGFHSRQGEHVRDPKTGAVREIDVMADIDTRVGDEILRCVHIVECKTNNQHPWVAFHRSGGIADTACIAQTIACKRSQARLLASTHDSTLRGLDLFRARSSTAFAGTEGFKPRESKDGFYGALQSVVSLSTLHAARHDEAPRQRVSVIVLPVIVIAGPLVAASYDQDTRALTVSEIVEARFHWKGAESWGHFSTVDVVRASHLEHWAAQRRADVDTLLRVLARKGPQE